MQREYVKYDVVICGGGPAGMTAALALADSGLRIALLEKDHFPREKICGGAVAAYVPKVLNTINPEYRKALEKFTLSEKVNTCRVFAPNGKALDLGFHESGFICKRLDFDNFLFNLVLQTSAISVMQDTKLTDVRFTEQGVIISTNNDTIIEAQLLIACDGAHSIARRKLTATSLDIQHHSAAVRAYFRNVAGITAGAYELHFCKEILPGYFWIFPLPDNEANVGLGMLSRHVALNKINLHEEMLKIIDNVPYIHKRFANAEMTGEIKAYDLPLGSRKTVISGSRFMLCGDAASLIDPATGEGIGQAMISGRYAGWQAKACFERNDFSAGFMKRYDKMVYDKLWTSNRRRYKLQRVIDKRPWLLNTAVNSALNFKFIHKMIEKFIAQS